MAASDFHTDYLNQLLSTKGITRADRLADSDREMILTVEEQAEKRSLMGLGKVINTGVRHTLRREYIYVALTTIDFEWGCQATLVLKKGNRLVGEEVRDPARLELLRARPDVWFMHRNFVIYKDRIDFPGDVVRKICHFEIPGLEADWLESARICATSTNAVVGVPSTLGDIFIKEKYFDRCDAHGLGTLLLGIDHK